MTKYEITEYLVNLNHLMTAQRGVNGEPSKFLLDEYSKYWIELKSKITESAMDDKNINLKRKTSWFIRLVKGG